MSPGRAAWNDPPGGFHPASAPDYLPPSHLRQLQLQRLQGVVTRAFERVPLFRSRMEERGLAPDVVRSLSDLSRLPFTACSRPGRAAFTAARSAAGGKPRW